MTAIIDPKHPVNDRIGVVKSGPKPSATNTRPGLTLNRKQVDWRAAMQSNEPETGTARPCDVDGCPRPAARRLRECFTHRNRRYRTGVAGGHIPQMRPRGLSLAESLNWPGVRLAPGGCQEFAGNINSEGYGDFWFSGARVTAHRVSYSLYVGDLSEGEVVRHRCDNRKCINPRHLDKGSVADNARDMVERGRSSMGERNGRAKLTEAQVREILVSQDSTASLARQFGVGETTVRKVRLGRSWLHIARDVSGA